MGLFSDLGRNVEKFKQAAEKAAAESATSEDSDYECRNCGERYRTDREECLECGGTEMVPHEE
ncbi:MULTISPECIES: hypothetical protein [Halorussus]|uniref:hypothetical protein n=1 Tax=Halorussus TaxID=1070314 RepID=UPI0020A1435C|nr:hypothetical protein [Halorussus vallis]USZ74820.1 hypothetical protein NGM07_15425 [Halorussus vallis]